MRYIERIAVLLAALILIGVLVISRQDTPPAQAGAITTAPACTDHQLEVSSVREQLYMPTRLPENATPVLRPAELLTLPWQIQEQAGTATMLTIQRATDPSATLQSPPEHIVLTLPWQIQEQVRAQPPEATTGC